MSTLNYIDENGNINKAGVIPKNYPASNIGYDNSQSGLSATNVQGAIDELRSADNIMMSDGVTSVESAINNIFHIESVSVSDHVIVANDGGFSVNCPTVSGKTPVFARYKTTTGYNVVFATTPLYRSSTDAWIVSLYSIYNQSVTTRGAVEIYYL